LVMKSGEKAFVLMGIGSAGGLLAGLFGVGGGIVMVPLLVIVCGFSQHRAHAMSLTGIVPIAAVGAIAFALQGQVDAGSPVCSRPGAWWEPRWVRGSWIECSRSS
jgi:uncharacterized membrane protein YfcA